MEVAPSLVPIKELTRLSSPSNMLPEAVSEALGISLSEVLDLYFRELDEVRRGCMIGDTLDRRVLGKWDRDQLEEESRRMEAIRISSYRKDSTFQNSKGFKIKRCLSVQCP
jgi:hypothetical protein